MRTLLAPLFALALFSVPGAAQAQYCWDTVCAAGTPAADCWRAWCPPSYILPTPSYTPSYSSSWSYPTYNAPTRAYWPDRGGFAGTGRPIFAPITQAQGCATGDPLDQVIWRC